MKDWIKNVNVFYMLCYAWNRLDQTELIDVASVGEHDRVVDLFASVLRKAVDDILRRGLDRGYTALQDESRGIRGRVDLSSSSGQLLLRVCRARCESDELSVDIAPNRLIRSTVRLLERSEGLDRRLREELTALHRDLRLVRFVELAPGAFDRITLHRNNRHYDFALAVCKLIVDSLLVDESSGSIRFAGFSRVEGMEMLFQWFVRRFYEREATNVRVSAPTSKWIPASGSIGDVALLPELRTDMLLEWAGRRLIIDTKFTDKSLVVDWRSGARRLNASHLYQVYAYVQNFSRLRIASGEVEGMLLYPRVSSDLRVDCRVHGSRLRICTVDLTQGWRHVHDELLSLLA